MPSLVAGGRHLGHTRMLLGPAGAREIAGLLAAIEAEARQNAAASAAFPYVDQADTALLAQLRQRGWTSYVSGRYSRLTVPADGFDGFLAALPSRRRTAMIAERRRIQGAGIGVEVCALTDFEDLVPLADLECQLLTKYGIAWSRSRAVSALEQIRAAFDRDAFVVLGYAEGRLRGFVLILAHHDQWYARQAGFDYEYQRQTRVPLYFELAYYSLIDEAGRNGVTTIHYGLGSEQAKRLRGCVISEQRCWVRRWER
jgi:predicted N-acyltransferase